MKSWSVVVRGKGRGAWSVDHFYVIKAKTAANALTAGLRRFEGEGIAFVQYSVTVIERKEKVA